MSGEKSPSLPHSPHNHRVVPMYGDKVSSFLAGYEALECHSLELPRGHPCLRCSRPSLTSSGPSGSGVTTEDPKRGWWDTIDPVFSSFLNHSLMRTTFSWGTKPISTQLI